jgi:branched-chain amino acid transport system ATP-binding protein
LVLRVFNTIEKIQKRGVTILLVEQNIHHALAIASRGYVLENGRIVLEGGSRQLIENKHVRESYLGA